MRKGSLQPDAPIQESRGFQRLLVDEERRQDRRAKGCQSIGRKGLIDSLSSQGASDKIQVRGIVVETDSH